MSYIAYEKYPIGLSEGDKIIFKDDDEIMKGIIDEVEPVDEPQYDYVVDCVEYINGEPYLEPMLIKINQVLEVKDELPQTESELFE